MVSSKPGSSKAGAVHDDDHHSSGHGHAHDRTSRRALLRAGLAVGATAALPRLGWAAAPQVTRDMARAAEAWLSRLDARQRREAQLEWTSRWREGWHYVPRSRPGVALRAMDASQTSAAWDLLGSLLSARGLDQVRGQLRLERILGELTGSLAWVSETGNSSGFRTYTVSHSNKPLAERSGLLNAFEVSPDHLWVSLYA